MSIKLGAYREESKSHGFYEFELIIAMAELSFYFPGNRDYIKEVNEWAAKVTGGCMDIFAGRRKVDMNYVRRRISELHADLNIAMELQDTDAIGRLKETKHDLEVLAAQPIQNGRRNQLLQR